MNTSVIRLNISDYLSAIWSFLSKADAGQSILLYDGEKSYEIIALPPEPPMHMTPELEAEIKSVHQEIARGECTTLTTHEDIERLLEG